MLKKNISSVRNLFESQYPALGIDVDGCIDESPIFFSNLTKFWPGDVFVISMRSDIEKLENFLNEKKIKFNKIFLVKKFEEKANIIRENGISIFIDDQPEVLNHIPDTVSVLLFRNSGNFNYGEKKWIFSEDTGFLFPANSK
jgi:uncharacterized HAD superfamily protein